MSSGLHRIAGGGNIAVLTAVVLSTGRFIFDPPAAGPGTVLPTTLGRARLAVLIVVDGLRADTAFDARAMPNFCRLSSAGTGGAARLHSLLPSKVA